MFRATLCLDDSYDQSRIHIARKSERDGSRVAARLRQGDARLYDARPSFAEGELSELVRDEGWHLVSEADDGNANDPDDVAGRNAIESEHHRPFDALRRDPGTARGSYATA